MSRLRSYVPAFVKRIVWNRKHQTTQIDPAGCPHDLLDSLRSLDPNAGVIDLGCGAGNLRAALRLRNWNGHYVGVDISEEILEVAKKSGDANAEWHASTIEAFPLPSKKVKIVCLCESLYYVRPGSVPTLIERCRKSLVSPGGRIVIRIWHTDRHPEYVALLTDMGAQVTRPIYTICG